MENRNNCIKVYNMKQTNKKSKIFVFFSLLTFLFLVSCPNASSDNYKKEKPKAYYTHEELNSMSSIEFSKILQLGWNLGNTFDSMYIPYQGKITGTENINKLLTSRENPLTTKSMIHEIKKMGFSTIRIPVTWHEHVDINNNYKIDDEWMARVKEVVDWSYEEQLYVIINIHHDERFKDANIPGLYFEESQKERSNKFIISIWTQIAETFKYYDNHLIFEVLNEPRYMECVSGNSFAPNQSERIKSNKIITEYEQTAVNTIRITGENNATRFIMVPPYAANIKQTYGWKIPKDSANDKLLISLHTYAPYEYAMGSDNNFTENHKATLRNLVNTQLQKQFISLGYGIVIGETSISAVCYTSKGLIPKEGREEWVKFYFSLTRDAGIPVIIWDNNIAPENRGNKASKRDYHGYLKRGSFTEEEEEHWYYEDLVQTMIDVYDYKY